MTIRWSRSAELEAVRRHSGVLYVDDASRVSEFEHLLSAGLRFHARDNPLPDLSTRARLLARIELGTFLGRLPTHFTAEQRRSALNRAIDFKLQVATLLITDWDLYDQSVFRLSPADSRDLRPGQQEWQKLRYYSLDQATVGKVHIMIERLISAIYCAETGSEIESEGARKKARAFRLFLQSRPHLSFFDQILAQLEEFDGQFRTPEYHKGSVLKKGLFADPTQASSEISAHLVQFLSSILGHVVPLYFAGTDAD